MSGKYKKTKDNPHAGSPVGDFSLLYLQLLLIDSQPFLSFTLFNFLSCWFRMQFSYAKIFILLALTHLVASHGAIVKAIGNAGGQGSAIGIDPDTPRNGTKRNPFQQDTTRFRGANKNTCGQTLAGGENDIQIGTQAVLKQNGGTLPQITPGGSIMMTLHQVNGDGAGPYTCMIDATGTGTQWQQIDVTQQVPGTNGNSKNRATDMVCFRVLLILVNHQLTLYKASQSCRSPRSNLCWQHRWPGQYLHG
jgi:hypothetical protein